MRETLKGYGKYFLGLAILIYAILSIVLKNKSILDNLDLINHYYYFNTSYYIFRVVMEI